MRRWTIVAATIGTFLAAWAGSALAERAAAAQASGCCTRAGANAAGMSRCPYSGGHALGGGCPYSARTPTARI